MIRESYAELYDLLVAARGVEYYRKTTTIGVAADTQELPSTPQRAEVLPVARGSRRANGDDHRTGCRARNVAKCRRASDW